MGIHNHPQARSLMEVLFIGHLKHPHSVDCLCTYHFSFVCAGFLSKELENAGIQPVPAGHVDAPDPQDMIDLESKFEDLENDVKEINGNTETLKRNLIDLIELRHIINAAQGFFETVPLGCSHYVYCGDAYSMSVHSCL